MQGDRIRYHVGHGRQLRVRSRAAGGGVLNVLTVPASFDRATLDAFLDEVHEHSGERVLFDARHVRWVDPNGLVGLLVAGSIARNAHGSRPRLELPESADVLSYMGRMGFHAAAAEVFDFESGARRGASRGSDVLLEVTPITTHSDVHHVVDLVQGKASAMLSSKLDYPVTAAVPFAVILSEVCQNVVEHSDAGGWVAAQTYHWKRRLGRQVVVISVMDVGRGFRGSLADEHSARYGDRWSDATALEAAFLHGLTRFPDSGRGQGIQQMRKQVRKWDGAISVRSGTARIAQVPEWDDAPPMIDGLAPIAGALITIVLPARVTTP